MTVTRRTYREMRHLSKGGPTERSEVEGGFLVFPPLDQGWSDSMSRDKLSLKPASQMPIRQLDV
jgi:hypothetical protein